MIPCNEHIQEILPFPKFYPQLKPIQHIARTKNDPKPITTSNTFVGAATVVKWLMR